MYTDFPNHNFTKQTNCALASLAGAITYPRHTMWFRLLSPKKVITNIPLSETNILDIQCGFACSHVKT